MKKILLAAGSLLAFCSYGYADVLTWGPASLSDDNAGALLTGFSISTSGPKWILLLPNFGQNGTFDFPLASEVTVAVSVSDAGGLLNGLSFTYGAAIDQSGGPASVHFEQTLVGSPGSPISGDFTSSSFSGTLTHSNTNQLDISLILDLHDSGGSAAVNQIEFDALVVPEPSSLILFGIVLGVVLPLKRRFR